MISVAIAFYTQTTHLAPKIFFCSNEGHELFHTNIKQKPSQFHKTLHLLYGIQGNTQFGGCMPRKKKARVEPGEKKKYPNRGFASMTAEKQREIARKGGRAA